jgi:hypothetical protein
MMLEYKSNPTALETYKFKTHKRGLPTVNNMNLDLLIKVAIQYPSPSEYYVSFPKIVPEYPCCYKIMLLVLT